ncbi:MULTISPECIES: TetR/AcrR family transcriptional regulator [Rhodopseudomonas]|uniref:TetR family transcriptional regulator n=1 Tax=Rhodopseudomonas palustris TaxID=1076 RepID=A0A0D7EIV4_RHOPL|nr:MULTISPECIES: TetR/AcrR family transcriptional regulator [Rhodopseudomonas]KIZ40754.1 TetR family transcriptional regulator [Rhodopseudomonas palustris]MDF3813743.1 TetR/AcrR family transcriptional regulator [Rhodopseudomonas sp. BAL398]WOK17631.1 TetR/AcrR family transcriptional regulator [Rhodopseudomonas sp. BAL398]
MLQKTAPKPPSPAPARKNMKSADREKAILEAAIAFFAEHGFEGQTRELAKRIGITHSAIYRHFPSKEALIERVYDHVYVSRWNPQWEMLIADRSRSLEDRLIQFYLEYVERIFNYEWVRIFVFSGLRSYDITGRYLTIIRDKLVIPVCRELRRLENPAAPSRAKITEREQEAVWGLHGQIFYIAIRKYVYGTPVPAELDPIITDHVRRFMRGFPPGPPPK